MSLSVLIAILSPISSFICGLVWGWILFRKSKEKRFESNIPPRKDTELEYDEYGINCRCTSIPSFGTIKIK